MPTSRPLLIAYILMLMQRHATARKADVMADAERTAFMRTSCREFLQTSALASLAAGHSTSVASDGRTAGISPDAHLNASEIA